MTLEEFLARFREQAPKREWWLRPDGAIRSDCGCPIETIARTEPGDVWRAVKRLGIGHTLHHQLVTAADQRHPRRVLVNGYLMGNHARIRRELLRATGLAT